MTRLWDKVTRRLFRPVHRLYYRWIHDRGLPGAAALGRRVRRFEERSGMGDAPVSRSEWDRQYAGGDWDFLHESDELARYAVIAAWVAHLAPGGRVLDVGGGEGLLWRVLADRMDGAPSRYLGLDLSEVAVGRGRERFGDDPRAAFETADAEDWRTEEPFDAIVFGESLYYFEHPEAAVETYRRFLAPGGVMVVSLFATPRSRAIRRALDRRRPPAEALDLRHAKGTWMLSIHRGPAAP
jgi:2-polyprenyl-3-methyl-5-hydroxy-6-metoxy-1,4-benzoquinol methylase